MKPGAPIVQMVAFSKDQQLNGYPDVMKECGIREMRMKPNQKRIWRDIPNRKWHANLKGKTGASREVALIHEALM